ncbi:MAG: NAD(P)H-hydrate dehydratase [Bacteroidales bacterium]|nr:NAD(P)H-hydrate dehydratase [Bacteroidales bacterium]
MKIFSTDQIKAIVQYTIEHEGVTELDLIERAAKGIADEIKKRWKPSKRTVVFAGWGNNGADALAASRLLLAEGFDPEIYLFNIGGSRLGEDCKACRDRLLEEFPNARLTEITQKFDIPELDNRTLVIDGLFGSGLNRALPQSFSVIIRSINESNADIVSIDLPSGLFGDWNGNTINNNIIHATLTIAIEFPRISFFIDDNAELIGEWTVVNIGLSPKAIRQAPYTFYLLTRNDVRRILQPRWPEHYKNAYGSALICAGSYGMMGAAVLAARGCLRAGVGKLTCHAPRCGYYIMQTSVPSAMFDLDPHDVAISEITLKHDFKAVGIGPGIGTGDITINALENFLKLANANGRALVLDADALNCIALRPLMLNYLPVMSVLMPHAGEFDRLFGAQGSAEARLRKAMEIAQTYNVVIVLKGRYTAVVRPDGKVHLNSSGSPALATAGSGDVLTGVITALMAQDYKPETAAIIGAFIHGVAGEISEMTHGTYGTTAEDIADNIGRAIKQIME